MDLFDVTVDALKRRLFSPGFVQRVRSGLAGWTAARWGRIQVDTISHPTFFFFKKK